MYRKRMKAYKKLIGANKGFKWSIILGIIAGILNPGRKQKQ